MHQNIIGLFDPNSVGSEVESAATTFGLALLAFLSQDNVLFLLGTLLATTRLTLEVVRLWRFLTGEPKPKDKPDV